MTSRDLVGASVFEERMYLHFNQHVAEEQGLIDEYSALADSTDSEALRYLVHLIVDDEIKHHRIFGELINAVRADVDVQTVEPQVPRLARWGSDPKSVLEATERFLRCEREDARQLKRLDKEMRDLRDTTLWSLLVKVMEADTAKHIQILEFVRERVKHHL